MFSIPVEGTYALVQVTTGTTATFGNTLQYGTTSYDVYYSYPSTANVGTNLTLSVTLHASQFTGPYEYAINYNLIVRVFIGSSVLTGGVASPNGSIFLYPGGNWGPNNVTIPLTAENTGLALGQSANATVGVELQDLVFYHAAESGYLSEPPMQTQAGSLVIQNFGTTINSSTSARNGNSSQGYFPYALLASGAVLIVLAAAFPWGRSPRKT